MTIEQCKELVKNIFGEEAANDETIVQWYMDVNKTAYDMAMYEVAEQTWDAALIHAKDVINNIFLSTPLTSDNRETYLSKYK